MSSSTMRLVPLGGLGEIGMNCLALDLDGEIVLIDCGVMFPFRELGVDVIHPSFEWLLERREHLRGVVLTHGHEDHVGGTPYLLREVPVPVYGPPYALAVLKNRLAETDLRVPPKLVPTAPRQPIDVGPFRIEPLRVTHSIPDATALAVRTPLGTVVHTGDFNIDEHPLDGQHFDEARLRELGDEGVRLLLSDSTNVVVPGDSGLERDVRDTLVRLVAEAPQRVVVSLFASNVHRVGSALEAARASGRRVCLLGRSVQTHVRMAGELGMLESAHALLVSPEQARRTPRDRLLVIATGTQGEAPAALTRLARGTHPDLTLESGDRVILSSRIIPGHEQSVYAIINDLERRGIPVCHRVLEPGVHVSGHACRDEQRRMLELVRPRAFIPVHGTFHHLRRHAELATEMGVEETLVVENGAVVELGSDTMRVTGQAPVGRVHVDAGEEITAEVLRDRALLAELGIAVVAVLLRPGGELAGPPEVITRGVAPEEAEPELVAGASEYVAEDLQSIRSPRLGFDEEEVRDRARRALRRYLRRRLGRKPLTYALVVQVP